MSDCEHYESLLSSWVDGETDGGPTVAVLDHFSRCDACRTFYLEARALDGLVAGVRPAATADPLPDRLWQRIRAAAELPARPARWRGRLPGWALRAAALVLVAIGVAFALLAPPPRATDGELEVRLEEADMSEARFVELTTEVLRADRRFHHAMLDVMEQVVDDTGGFEGSPGERRVRDDEGGEGERATGGEAV